ncbi:MAG: glyoxalase/bleomycin resistance/dioxygenase family protein [Ahniella sp.]|nr:glyoxalase/bleomycin resistance/dioxygenase family protein [Ahniella sp.]
MMDHVSAGLFVYAKDLARMASFYEAVLDMARAHSSAELVVLKADQFQLIVDAIPEPIAAQIEVASPPERREEAAYKFFFTVPSLDAAHAQARDLGGEVLAESWRGPGFIVRNAVDPEGNIFQLRELIPVSLER